MKPKHVKIFAAIIAMILALFMILPFIIDILHGTAKAASPSVSDLQSKLKSLTDKQSQLKKEMDDASKQKSSVLQKKYAIDQQVTNTQDQIDTINTMISSINTQIDKTQKTLDKAEQDEKKEFEVYKLRIRAMEEDGSATYLGVLLSADSFSDFVSRTEVIAEIIQYDDNILQQLNETKNTIAASKAKLVSDKNDKTAAKTQLTSKMSSLATQQKQFNDIVKQLEGQITSKENDIDEETKQMNEARSQINKILADRNKGNGGGSKYVGGRFSWPLPPGHTYISSPFGWRFDPYLHYYKGHTGIDLPAPKGTPIYAAGAGTVIQADYIVGFGNHVVIDHGGGIVTLYGHMSKIIAQVGQVVKTGDTIGLVGTTGYSTGNHLHFEVDVNGTPVNPIPYLQG